jgi:hypothetical protein
VLSAKSIQHTQFSIFNLLLEKETWHTKGGQLYTFDVMHSPIIRDDIRYL